MTANSKIKVTLKRVYEYDISEIYELLDKDRFIYTVVNPTLLLERAKEQALIDFSSEMPYFEEDIEDFVRATATIEGTGSEHNTSYNLITWPESQNFMEEEWFEDEAILALGNEDMAGSGAYFIPTHRLKK